MPPKRASPKTVSARRLFDWFEADKDNRSKLREAGYTDGRITNWKKRGIPRAEVADVAGHMGLTHEQYVRDPNAVQEPPAEYRALSDAALEVARRFDQLSADCKEHVSRQIDLLRGAQTDSSGRRRAVQHDVRIKRDTLQPDGAGKRKKGVR